MIAIFPEIISSAKERDLERLAILARQYYAGTDLYSPKLDMESLIRTAGIKLDRLAIEEDAVLCVRDLQGSFEVVAIINQAIHDSRQCQFLLAHLLGHFLLHVQPHIAEGSWKTSGLRELVSPIHRYSRALESAHNDQSHERMEREADDFAAALLLPIGMIRKATGRLTDLQRVADFFGTTEGVIRRRTDEVNGNRSTPTSFVDAESRIRAEESSHALTLGRQPQPPLHSESHSSEPTRMPRAVAANSYKSMEKRTETASAPSVTSASTVSQTPAKTKRTGIARLRELAKRYDQTVKVDPES